jgi:hypothetical protein
MFLLFVLSAVFTASTKAKANVSKLPINFADQYSITH